MSEVLSKRLSYLRDKSGLTQKFVAEKMGIANNTLSSYESGDRKPSPELIAKFAEFYEVTTDYLLGVSDSMYRTKAEEEFVKGSHKSIQELREMFHITYDEREITDEDLKGMLAWLIANRTLDDPNKK